MGCPTPARYDPRAAAAMSRKSMKASKQAVPAAAEEEAVVVPPQDFGAKGAAYAETFDAFLKPLLLEVLTKLEEAVELDQGAVKRPADPRAWLSTYLHIDSYKRQNAALRDEVAALKAKAAELKVLDDERRANLPPEDEEAEDAE